MIWQSPTAGSVGVAVSYYQDTLEGPTWFTAFLVAATTVSVSALLGKLIKGTTSRILFDGGSLRKLRRYKSARRAFPKIFLDTTSIIKRCNIHSLSKCPD